MISDDALCTICARGGSKGVPNKNIRIINGKPLIAHSIERAMEAGFKQVVVSTDSKDIAAQSERFGAYILYRTAELATDFSPKLPVIKHAFLESEKLFQKNFSYLFDLDATSMLRNVDDILACYEMLISGNYRNIITACPARRSPYFNLVEINNEGVPFLSKGQQVFRRQDAPPCYDMNASIYAWIRDSILCDDSLFGSKTGLYIMPEERSLDIDTEFDFRIVKALAEAKI